VLLGWMHVGSDKIYDISCGRFSRRHPELFDGLNAPTPYHLRVISIPTGILTDLAENFLRF
jgi:hypothetical protein